jgi:transcriptional regulator GlxA family with amidase domain
LKAGGNTRRISVYVVVPPRTLLLDIAGPVEVLRCANRVQQAVHFDVSYVGAAQRVTSSIGLRLAEIKPLPHRLPDNAMILLAGDVGETMDEATRNEADSEVEAATVDWLKAAIQPGHRLVSICSGALLAARAGLLDGRSCTTQHFSYAELATVAPKARVLDNRLFVEDGPCYTSAGVTAGIDLMLHIVSRITNHRCAAEIARYLVVYIRRSGADPQLSPWFEGRNHMHPAVHCVQDAIAADPARNWTLQGLSRIAGASPRHLSRLFHEHVGINIPDYRNRLRVALAQELLAQTKLDMEHVAERAGFASTRQLRRAWGKLHPTPPREARGNQPSAF